MPPVGNQFQKFTKCLECTNFRDALSTRLIKEDRLVLFEQRRVHLKLQEIAREKYYKHRTKSRDNPSAYVSCIIDNMDSGKTNLPRFPESFKNESSLCHMHHHVTGVLDHGLDKAFIFTWTDQFSSDCNITLNCLMKVLENAAEANGGHLPPVLYLQADNSAKDNKNRFVLSFLAMLVEADILKKVKISFLMVGHTHEDVDQMFSCVNRLANQRKIITIDDLHKTCRESYTPPPVTMHLSSLWDFRSLAAFDGGFCGIQEPHIFRIKKIDGTTTLRYRNWPLQSENYRHLPLAGIIPELTRPNLVVPKMAKIRMVVEEMEKDLPRWAEAGKLNEREVQWWRDYLEELKLERRDEPEVPTTLPTYRESVQTSLLDSNLGNCINRHMDKLQHVAELRVTRRTRPQ